MNFEGLTDYFKNPQSASTFVLALAILLFSTPKILEAWEKIMGGNTKYTEWLLQTYKDAIETQKALLSEKDLKIINLEDENRKLNNHILELKGKLIELGFSKQVEEIEKETT